MSPPLLSKKNFEKKRLTSFMSQKSLDNTKVYAVFHQVGSKGVT